MPDSHLENVLDVLSTRCGHIGNYTGCMFITTGEARFTPGEGSHPTVGTIGRTEVVQESRVETTCLQDELADVVAAIRKAHPYEEPGIEAYDMRLL